MPRFFTLLSAEALLPEVETLLRGLVSAKREYEQTEAQLSRLHLRIQLAGGMVPPRDTFLHLKEDKERSANRLRELAESLGETGCQLKDVDTGLVDFPTLYHGKEVYLCWKLGEKGISFWHHIEDGFRGRRAIDSDFLANHRGDLSH